MIQKFKRKAIAVLTVIFWSTLIGILFVINLSNYHSNRAETEKILTVQREIVTSGERSGLPDDNDNKLSKIYSVTVDDNGKYSLVYAKEEGNIGNEAILELAKGIASENRVEGVYSHYRYKVMNIEDGKLISFIDYSIWEQQQQRMISYSLLIGAVGMVLLVLVAAGLTGWMTKPVVTAFERQKDFISGAGHELKTPLTVMKASLDMLEKEYGTNKYFGYIRAESSRMTDLVYELLSLSALENDNVKSALEKLDLSRVTEGTCLPFESLAFENGLTLDIQIQEELFILGNEAQLRQMIEILLDNAVRHAAGRVEIRLKKEKGKAVLSVRNQGEPIPEAERSKIFDRFYRVDKSRSRSEGRFGLGLAIAASIAEAHKTRITLECKENWTVFNVKFTSL